MSKLVVAGDLVGREVNREYVRVESSRGWVVGSAKVVHMPRMRTLARLGSLRPRIRPSAVATAGRRCGEGRACSPRR
jgi:hypothetical protein